MIGLDKVELAAASLKIFPLPSAVLLPGGVMPLHIFEPRYRALVADALATDSVMALGGLEPGWEANYSGKPGLSPLCCAGIVLSSELQDDGRYNILLRGVMRARVLEELTADKPYREVKVELLPDAPFHGAEEELVRQAILELAARVPQGVAQNLVQMASRASGGMLADVVASAIISDTDARIAILHELDVKARLSRVLDEVGVLIARLGTGRAGEPMN